MLPFWLAKDQPQELALWDFVVAQHLWSVQVTTYMPPFLCSEPAKLCVGLGPRCSMLCMSRPDMLEQA